MSRPINLRASELLTLLKVAIKLIDQLLGFTNADLNFDINYQEILSLLESLD